MPITTQADLDLLSSTVRGKFTDTKLQKLEADLAARAALPIADQERYLTRILDALESIEIAEYLPTAKSTSKSNPFSKSGWNKSEQGRLHRVLGEAKCMQLANAAGIYDLGATKPNPDFN